MTDLYTAPLPVTTPLISPTVRAWVYAVALTVAAGAIIFANLGGPRMEGDEAHYALCTDAIRHTGQWLTPRPRPPGPYLNKPPLYMWLSAATYDLVPGFAEKYRFWSAAFGVGCVGLTCALGRLLFTPEIGALAGALLLTNRQFLLEHGARAGDMDAGLTLLMAASLVLLWLIITGRIAWWGWAGIGVAAGLASLFKPFFGASTLATVFILAGAFGRGVPWRSRVEGMLLASLLAVVVAGPWYLIQWMRFKDEFLDVILRRQILDRFTTGLNAGETKGVMFYLWGEAGDREESITFSSPAFIAALPALAFAAVAGFATRRRRRAFGLIAATGMGWVVCLSLFKGKFLHYAYPIFPVLCVALAAMSAELLRLAAARLRDDAARARFLTGASVAAAVGFVIAFCRLGFHVMPEQQKKFVPWETYQTFRPAIESGTARFILYGVPAAPAEWDEVEPAASSTDLFYLWHMRGAIRVATSEELELMLQVRRPTLSFLSKRREWIDVYDQGRLGGRIDERFTLDHRTFTCLALDLDALLRPRLSPGADSPYLQLLGVDPPRVSAGGADGAATPPAGWPFAGTFTVRVRPPLPQETRVNVMIRRTGETKSCRVRAVIAGVRPPAPGPMPVAFDAGLRLGAIVERDPRNPSAARDVTFKLLPAEEPAVDEVIRGTITDVWLDVQVRPAGMDGAKR